MRPPDTSRTDVEERSSHAALDNRRTLPLRVWTVQRTRIGVHVPSARLIPAGRDRGRSTGPLGSVVIAGLALATRPLPLKRGLPGLKPGNDGEVPPLDKGTPKVISYEPTWEASGGLPKGEGTFRVRKRPLGSRRSWVRARPGVRGRQCAMGRPRVTARPGVLRRPCVEGMPCVRTKPVIFSTASRAQAQFVDRRPPPRSAFSTRPTPTIRPRGKPGGAFP